MQLISTLNIYSANQVLSQAFTTNMFSDKVQRKETVKLETMSKINNKRKSQQGKVGLHWGRAFQRRKLAGKTPLEIVYSISLHFPDYLLAVFLVCICEYFCSAVSCATSVREAVIFNLFIHSETHPCSKARTLSAPPGTCSFPTAIWQPEASGSRGFSATRLLVSPKPITYKQLA